MLYDKIADQYRYFNGIPNTMIIGRKAMKKLRKEVGDHLVAGMKVNLNGEPVSFWGMTIQYDEIEPDRVQIGYVEMLSTKGKV